jgi:hypothetical protein
MDSLIKFFKESKNRIELGQISEVKGGGLFIVIINGMTYQAISSIKEPLSTGRKVLITKLESGKRYITGHLSTIGKQDNLTEVIRNG